jgi:putative membrane protein
MTSSEGELPPVEDASAPARVWAAGHLHPGMLFLRLFDGLRAAVLPVLVSIVARQTWLAAATLVFFVIGMMYVLARYLTFQYRLTGDELVTTEGLLYRQERRIPVNRIQDLSFESTLLRRVFGLVVVSVETASGQGAEARLDSLSRRHAAHLRDVLYALRASRHGGTAPAALPSANEWLVYRATAGELAVLGMTNNRLGAILLAIVGLLELADQAGLGGAVGGAFGAVGERLSRFGAPFMVVFVVAGLFLFVLAGWLVSVVASLVMFHGFTLTLREDVLHRRYGLITTRAQTLPRRKVQRVLLEQSLLRRLCGVVVVRADSAGSGSEERTATRSGRDVIVPLTRGRAGEEMLPALLPGFRGDTGGWRRVSPRIVLRIFLKGVLLTALVLAVGLPLVGAVALAAVVILPIGWAIGFLSFDNLAWADAGDHVLFRWGIVGRYRAYVPLRKVQGVVLRAGPIERLLGLAQVTVYVAGGSPTTLANLARDQADWLLHSLAERAARSRFVW